MPLKRVLEPEVMDSVEEARDYDQMDHAAVNDVFVTDLLASGEIAGEVLDLGTGTAAAQNGRVPSLNKTPTGGKSGSWLIAGSLMDAESTQVQMVNICLL